MVYLIDDKINRQIDYGWSKSRIKSFSKVLYSINTFEDIKNLEVRSDIFKIGNTVIFHESFFDNVNILHKHDSLTIRKKLTNFAIENKDFNVVYFSGSKNSRKLESNIASLPASIVYQNLKVFLNKIAENNTNLEYLLFGENITIEKELQFKFDKVSSNYTRNKNF